MTWRFTEQDSPIDANAYGKVLSACNLLICSSSLGKSEEMHRSQRVSTIILDTSLQMLAAVVSPKYVLI